MINELIELNRPQQLSVLSKAKSEVNIHGRGTGKSYIIGWEMNRIIRSMPRSVTSITGRTFGQIYTRTLPSTLKFLEKAKALKKPILIGLMPLKSVKMARFVSENVQGIDVPEEIIDKMENEGASGIDIICDFLTKVHPFIDGIHIMAMGDILGTNKIIEFMHSLGK